MTRHPLLLWHALQDWAKDWLRHAAKANHMLYSKSGQDHEAAVLLVEAAAGAAKWHKQLTTGGSDGLMPHSRGLHSLAAHCCTGV